MAYNSTTHEPTLTQTYTANACNLSTDGIITNANYYECSTHSVNGGTQVTGCSTVNGTYTNPLDNNGNGGETVTFYYKKRHATLTINHYIKGTTTPVHSADTFDVIYGNDYDNRN